MVTPIPGRQFVAHKQPAHPTDSPSRAGKAVNIMATETTEAKEQRKTVAATKKLLGLPSSASNGQVIAAASKRLAHFRERDRVVDEAYTAGKITAAGRQAWRKRYDDNPAETTQVLASLASGLPSVGSTSHPEIVTDSGGRRTYAGQPVLMSRAGQPMVFAREGWMELGEFKRRGHTAEDCVSAVISARMGGQAAKAFTTGTPAPIAPSPTAAAAGAVEMAAIRQGLGLTGR